MRYKVVKLIKRLGKDSMVYTKEIILHSIASLWGYQAHAEALRQYYNYALLLLIIINYIDLSILYHRVFKFCFTTPFTIAV